MQRTNKNDLLDLFKPPHKQSERYTSKHAVNIHEFYLCGTIESAEEYIEWFDIIRSSTKNDVIKIYINSYGGDLFTAIQFLRVLTETEANIIISVEGACMSAATILLMCGHNFEVSEHSMFMFHNYSSGVMGKGGEMFDQLKHERAWSEKLHRDIYADFLTEKEITAILENKDIWMDGEEVIKRLKKKVKKLEKEVKVEKVAESE
jgi:ATP-dependent protease ClpP protease subunit